MRFQRRVELLMPVFEDTVKFVSKGTIGSTGQSWSCGFTVNVGAGTPVTQALLDTYAASVHTPVDTFWNAISAFWSSTVIYKQLLAYFYPGGSASPSFVSAPTVSGAVGSGAANLPGFCSLVASLRSTTPTRSGRGRMYLPINKESVTTDGEASSAHVTLASVQTATLITAVNGIAPGFSSLSGDVAVASAAQNQCYNIAKVIVDSKIDVQHRRTDKLGADFTTTTPV